MASQQLKKQYYHAYQRLNENQKKAVRLIQGSVMVIAGPGTGKTQLLAARVGYILEQTDTSHENILCLTFTDAGALSMRKRLLEFIGPDAYRIPIHTYHSFCNEIINENKAEFTDNQDLRAINKLEKYILVEEILSELPHDHFLSSASKAHYSLISNLIEFFDQIKKENWTPESMIAKYKQDLIQDQSAFLYKRNTKNAKKGELKKDKWAKHKFRIEKSMAAAELYPQYKKKMHDAGFFDFADMILWVLDKFESDDAFLGQYQEKYQYVLLDEYQDTNGAQNDLVFKLTSFWEDPNIFAVGDDDQSIFKFQGANTENLIDYEKRFKPETIVLENNYRSTQSILNAAKSLIEKNTQRLVNHDSSLTKELIASHPDRQVESILPEYIEVDNPRAEKSYIYHYIADKHSKGESIKDIAIIYPKHKHANDLMTAFRKKNIPFQAKKQANLFDLTLFQQIENLMGFIRDELQFPGNGDHRLFEILHYNFFNLDSQGLSRLSQMIYRQRKSWSLNLQDIEVESDDEKEILNQATEIVRTLMQLKKDALNDTLQIFFEKLLHDTGLMDYILAHDAKDNYLQIITTLFDFLKEESEKNPGITVSDFLQILQLMKDYNLELPVQLASGSKNGVNLMTAHGSKGLEFKEVFIIGCTQDAWLSNRGRTNTFFFPHHLESKNKEVDIEEKRRLFYVALTRAQERLKLTIPIHDKKAKENKPLQFLDEIEEDAEVTKREVESGEKELEFFTHLVTPQSQEMKIIDPDRIDQAMESFAMSVTALNKYLRCHYAFYFETILRVPAARNSTMGFGSAVHEALEDIFRKASQGDKITDDYILLRFKAAMERYASHFTPERYQSNIEWSQSELIPYVRTRLAQMDAKEYAFEYSVKNTSIEGIPVSGKMDKIEIYDDHVHVVDYKTGSADKSSIEQALKAKTERMTASHGGDYWRQMTFYKMLLQADQRNSYKMRQGSFDFVQKSSKYKTYKMFPLDIGIEDINTVREQLVTSWNDIINHKFDKGCDNCRWCDFINSTLQE